MCIKKIEELKLLKYFVLLILRCCVEEVKAMMKK